MLNNPITEPQIPSAIARDTETAAAIAAHVAAPNPHPQYLRILNNFEDTVNGPINLSANTWQSVGNSRVIGEQGVGATWIVNVYFEYNVEGIIQKYFQYCGSGIIGAIFWQADFLTSEGIPLAVETHNEHDFTLRFRFGNGQARKVELKPDKDVSIVAPGFLKLSGIRIL